MGRGDLYNEPDERVGENRQGKEATAKMIEELTSFEVAKFKNWPLRFAHEREQAWRDLDNAASWLPLDQAQDEGKIILTGKVIIGLFHPAGFCLHAFLEAIHEEKGKIFISRVIA